MEVTGGVDSELFRPVAPDPSSSAPARRPRILLYVGRFVPLKNLPMLIDAFAAGAERTPGCRAGDGGRGRAGGADSRAGRAPRPDRRCDCSWATSRSRGCRACTRRSDVVLLSSSFDNSPNCILEANACERPVVATRVGGVPRYVTEGENGLLAAAGDADGFARAILRAARPARACPHDGAGRPAARSWSATPGVRAPRSSWRCTSSCWRPAPGRCERAASCDWRSSTTARTSRTLTAGSGKPRVRSAGTSSRWRASWTRSS